MMKKIALWSICLTAFMFSANTSFAQKKPTKAEKKQAIENRSYAYGAMISKGIARMGLTPDEKNPDKFTEGMKKGVEGDSAEFANAQEVLKARMQTRQASADKEAAGKIAYSLGLSAIGGLAQEVKIPATDFNWEVFKAAFVTAEAGSELKFTDPQMDSILKAYFEPKNAEYQKNAEAKKVAAAAVAIDAGKKFLEKNGKREGVITLPSGMQYEVVKASVGPKPTINDKVRTHYHGTLINGDVFDSSVERGEPITFPLNGVIKGWQEGIPLMPVGSKYKLYIPQELAYGLQSPSPKIPGGSTLIFEVELLEINPVDQAALDRAAKEKAAQDQAQKAIQAGVKFLEENKKKEGIITLPSGLQYEILVEGEGPKPTLTDKVKTHYHGTLIDGSVFDSSVERGKPATFGVNQVIRGWQEGIPLMSAGAKYRFYIPQELAYGMRSPSPKIPAGSALIFEVELIQINPTN